MLLAKMSFAKIGESTFIPNLFSVSFPEACVLLNVETPKIFFLEKRKSFCSVVPSKVIRQENV